ncbi:MAG TPA: short-chain dehydrogenase [Micromonosporaceae bacterium]|nr:short-chain dehydrogenase [Micromonosporaceae bacterium]
MNLEHDIALVTGAGSGIGEAIAHTLAEAGATVAVADLRGEAATKVAEAIVSKGGRAIAVAVDIADGAAVEQALATIREQAGPVSILVNNAAGWVVKLFKDTTEEEAQRVVGVTLLGTMNVTRSALPDLFTTRGRIVNIISDSARTGEYTMSVYAAAKAGIIGLTKSVAKEVGRKGVTVNAVSPGTTDTPGASGFIDSVGGAEKLAKAYPMGRIGEPSDIANAVLFFASPLSSWITGQTLSVSGGFTMI